MRYSSVSKSLGWIAAACLASSSLARADDALLSAQRLGLMEGAAGFCEALDKPSAEHVREAIRQATRGVSAARLSELRNSGEYKQAYDSVQGFVGHVDPHNAKKLCAEFPGSGK